MIWVCTTLGARESWGSVEDAAADMVKMLGDKMDCWCNMAGALNISLKGSLITRATYSRIESSLNP